MTAPLIRNRARASQVKDFSGLKWGPIIPTDIDFCVEFRNKLFIIGDAKQPGAELSVGQKIAFERIVDAIWLSGKPAVFLVIEHDTAPDEDIDFEKTVVVRKRMNGKWEDLETPRRTKDVIDELLKLYAPECLI